MPKKPSKVTTSATKHKLPANHPLKAKPKKRKKHTTSAEIASRYAHIESDTPEPETTLTTFPPLEVARAIPCGEDTTTESGQRWETAYFANLTCRTCLQARNSCNACSDDLLAASLPPDTSSYPWPLKFAWKVDGWMVRARVYLAERLSRLAQWVTPK